MTGICMKILGTLVLVPLDGAANDYELLLYVGELGNFMI